MVDDSCPSPEELAAIAEAHRGGPAMVEPHWIICEEGWVYAGTALLIESCAGSSCWSDPAHGVWRRQDGQWVLEHLGGTGPLRFFESERADYRHWPETIRAQLGSVRTTVVRREALFIRMEVGDLGRGGRP